MILYVRGCKLGFSWAGWLGRGRGFEAIEGGGGEGREERGCSVVDPVAGIVRETKGGGSRWLG